MQTSLYLEPQGSQPAVSMLKVTHTLLVCSSQLKKIGDSNLIWKKITSKLRQLKGELSKGKARKIIPKLIKIAREAGQNITKAQKD